MSREKHQIFKTFIFSFVVFSIVQNWRWIGMSRHQHSLEELQEDCSQLLLVESGGGRRDVGGFDHQLLSMDQESRMGTIPLYCELVYFIQWWDVCMCCSQVFLKEYSSREEERAVALASFYFLWIRNPGRGQPPFLWPSILQNFNGALYVRVARRSSSRNLAAGRKRGRRSWREVGGEHTLVGGTSLVVLPWRLENLSEMSRNLAPQGQVAGIRFIDKVSRMIKISTKQAFHSS